MDRDGIKNFEVGFKDGVYAVPSNTKIKVRALYKFCKENNIAPDELTEEQIAQFIEKRDK
ncbi:hypothetical protein [Alkalihalobacterium bogoriense]|uniref:hypothetical protein n=1 Tax=Alkalihalobacterium bogoriense TaxID=246272 RepID=UPI00047D6BA8|nr:hypothetical protein [Alkalihalobacterium bogoriense]